MKTFEERKKHCLWKMQELDKSKKGSIDEPIKNLLDAINEKDDYYTTSSCSGRILLLHEPNNQKKNEHEWPVVTHHYAEEVPFMMALRELEGSEGRVWFRMQTAIIHVACRNMDAANKLLEQFHKHGWKRSGVFSWANDVMVELLSVEHIDVPVMEQGMLKVSENYMPYLISLANEKIATVWGKIAKAEERVKNNL